MKKKSIGTRQQSCTNRKHRQIQTHAQMSTLEFFTCLYGEYAPGYLTIWTRKDQKTQWVETSELPLAARTVKRLAADNDVYYGVGLQEKELETHQRGKAEDVVGIPGLWLDIDLAGVGHKASNLPTSMEQVEKLIGEFSLPPSLLVHTGHGIHAYWLFKKPWRFENVDDKTKAQELSTQFQRRFQILAGAKGWHIDNTSDLSRLLRVPGTFNRKGDPLPVTVMPQPVIRRYDPEEFSVHLTAQQATAAHPPVDSESKSKVEVAPQADLILAGCEFLQHCRDDAAQLPEPHWYAMISNLAPTDGGAGLVHELSKPYPAYTEHETNEKIRHALEIGPHTCESIEKNGGAKWCEVCPHRTKITAPILLGRPPWHSSVELLQLSPPKMDWLIEGVIPASNVILLSGREGSMKTWLAMDWALAVAQGRGWLSRATKIGKVLYIDAEMPRDLFSVRLQALGTSPSLAIWRWQDRYFPSNFFDRQLLLAARTYRLIVVDTLRRFMGKRDENSATDMAAIMGGLRELTRWGATVIALHHAPKDPEKREGYRGSTELGAGVDIVYALRKHEEGGNVELRVRTTKTRCCSEADLTLRVERTETRPILRDVSAREGTGVEVELLELRSVIAKLEDELVRDPNQTEIVEKVADMGLGSRGKTLGRLKRGDGRYWRAKTCGRQCSYTTLDVSTCPMAEGMDKSDNRVKKN